MQNNSNSDIKTKSTESYQKIALLPGWNIAKGFLTWWIGCRRVLFENTENPLLWHSHRSKASPLNSSWTFRPQKLHRDGRFWVSFPLYTINVPPCPSYTLSPRSRWEVNQSVKWGCPQWQPKKPRLCTACTLPNASTVWNSAVNPCGSSRAIVIIADGQQ